MKLGLAAREHGLAALARPGGEPVVFELSARGVFGSRDAARTGAPVAIHPLPGGTSFESRRSVTRRPAFDRTTRHESRLTIRSRRAARCVIIRRRAS